MRRWSLLTVVAVLSTATLACASSRSASGGIADSAPLPTLTRTPLPTLTPTPVSTPVLVAIAAEAGPDTVNAGSSSEPAEAPALADVPAAGGNIGSSHESEANPARNSMEGTTATFTDTPTPIPTATETAVPTNTPTIPAVIPVFEVDGWQFSGIRLANDPDPTQLRLYGEVTNQTDTARELSSINGTFYDSTGAVIAGPELVSDNWPIDAVPPGGRLPFWLNVTNGQSVANFDLQIEAGPSRESPHQEFEFVDLEQTDQAGSYCIGGRLRNRGNELASYLTIIAVLYDSQDQVIGFSDWYDRDPEGVTGDQSLSFEICVDRSNQEVAHHELRAWGL